MSLFDFLKKKEFEEIKKLKSLLERFQPILDVEAEVEKQKKEFSNVISLKLTEIENLEGNFDKLSSDYQTALETYTKLRKEISLFENKLDLIEFGVYEPIYDFEKSEDYRVEQNKVIELQKELISSEKAAILQNKLDN